MRLCEDVQEGSGNTEVDSSTPSPCKSDKIQVYIGNLDLMVGYALVRLAIFTSTSTYFSTSTIFSTILTSTLGSTLGAGAAHLNGHGQCIHIPVY
jgi:hypothetical protein